VDGNRPSLQNPKGLWTTHLQGPPKPPKKHPYLPPTPQYYCPWAIFCSGSHSKLAAFGVSQLWVGESHPNKKCVVSKIQRCLAGTMTLLLVGEARCSNFLSLEGISWHVLYRLDLQEFHWCRRPLNFSQIYLPSSDIQMSYQEVQSCYSLSISRYNQPNVISVKDQWYLVKGKGDRVPWELNYGIGLEYSCVCR
jgi:hypothetical protein